jgi:hypothetical protein
MSACVLVFTTWGGGGGSERTILIFESVADPGCLLNPGSDFFPSRIPDPNCLHPGSRIRIKELKYFNPQKNLSSRKYYPGCSSRIPDPDSDFLSIPDLGVKKAPDPGSATLFFESHLSKSKQKNLFGSNISEKSLKLNLACPDSLIAMFVIFIFSFQGANLAGSMATASGAFSQPPGVGMGAVMLSNPQVQVMLTNPQVQVMLTNPQVQVMLSNPQVQVMLSNPQVQVMLTSPQVQVMLTNPQVQVMHTSP